MSALERMQIFVRVAELASFTQAADTLGLPKATVSTAVQQLEADLGARLLHRTTRRVQTTQHVFSTETDVVFSTGFEGRAIPLVRIEAHEAETGRRGST